MYIINTGKYEVQWDQIILPEVPWILRVSLLLGRRPNELQP